MRRGCREYMTKQEANNAGFSSAYAVPATLPMLRREHEGGIEDVLCLTRTRQEEPVFFVAIKSGPGRVHSPKSYF